MPFTSIKKVHNLKNKRVMVRVDFNVPVSRGRVLDDTRLRESLPTIEYLIKRQAKVIIVTHLGRPAGKRLRALKLDPVARRLSELLKQKVKKLPRWSGVPVEKEINGLGQGQAVMLENIRFSPVEKNDQGTLSQELAGLADLFVLDGFAVAHRGDASVSGVAKYLPAYAGLLLEREVKGLEKVTKQPAQPFVIVIGGAKIETKVPVIKNLLPKADHILVGGGIVNTYLKAMGYKVGDSLVDDEFKKEAVAYAQRRKVILPVDVVVGTVDGKKYRVVAIGKKPHAICPPGEGILDVGPQTIRLFAGYIKRAKTIVWNGAMGKFEQKPYDVGTLAIARLVASRSKGKAYGVIGGGETLQAMELTGMSEYVDLISTGGGAMLEFLSGQELPGIEALTSS